LNGERNASINSNNMATFEETEQDFSRLPDLPAEVFTAPLKKPDHVGDDWLEPQQTQYDSDDDAIWNDLFERQMGVLPGRAAVSYTHLTLPTTPYV
jgi:phenylalanine-4-hydroxylase